MTAPTTHISAPNAPKPDSKPIGPMLQRAMQRDPKTSGLGRKLFFRFFQTCTAIGALLNYRIQATGQHNIPTNPEFISVANHLSNWDPPVVAHTLGQFPLAFMAKRELFETHPFLTWVLEGVGCIALDRDNVGVASIKSAKNIAAKTGWVVSLFPEGTRQKALDADVTDAEQTEDSQAKRGAAFLAKTIGQPVLPMAIHYGTKKTGWLWRRKTAWVRIGELIPVDKKADMDELTASIMASIRTLQQQVLADSQASNA